VARTKKSKGFLLPSGIQAIRAKFLQYAFAHESSAFLQLATEVREGRTTVRQWADSYHLGGTWVEEWAKDTLEAWNTGTCPSPVVIGSKVASFIDGTEPSKHLKEDNEHAGTLRMFYPEPRDEHDLFSFSCRPLSRLAHKSTVYGAPWWKENTTETLEGIKKEILVQVGKELDKFFTSSEAVIQHDDGTVVRRLIASGVETTLPSDLDLKLEAAAVYYFCGRSPEAIQFSPKGRSRPKNRVPLDQRGR
jgi:hypothetical protein